MFILLGFVVWAWSPIWSLIRNIESILAPNENRSIANPYSGLLG